MKCANDRTSLAEFLSDLHGLARIAPAQGLPAGAAGGRPVMAAADP